MRANRRRDTGPELRVRRLLHRSGLRFRVDRRPESTIPVRADVVFPRQRLALFIDGCYWHMCPDHCVLPKTRLDFWLPKLQGNRHRDAEVDALLSARGWKVLRAWEHEPEAAVLLRVRAALEASTANVD